MKPKKTRVKIPTAVYQLKISLKHTSPKVWRRLLVPDCTLDDLHEIIQVAMGWENYHMYAFQIGGREFTRSDMNDGMLDMENSSAVRLGQLITAAKQRFGYTYDFGDDWHHDILVEKIIAPAEGDAAEIPGRKFPVCVKGSRACPPEDVGGPWGFAEYLEAMANPKHERHEEFMEWSGEFDAEAFDMEGVNKRLRKVL
jgi:hypothetical protein